MHFFFKGAILIRFLRKFYVPVTHKVIAFYSFRRRRCAFTPTLPGQHALAYVNTAIIDQIGFDHPVTGCFKQPGNRHPQGAVAQMTQIQGLICIGRQIFDHYAFVTAGGGIPEGFSG